MLASALLPEDVDEEYLSYPRRPSCCSSVASRLDSRRADVVKSSNFLIKK
jgi:hypothetical protein